MRPNLRLFLVFGFLVCLFVSQTWCNLDPFAPWRNANRFPGCLDYGAMVEGLRRLVDSDDGFGSWRGGLGWKAVFYQWLRIRGGCTAGRRGCAAGSPQLHTAPPGAGCKSARCGGERELGPPHKEGTKVAWLFLESLPTLESQRSQIFRKRNCEQVSSRSLGTLSLASRRRLEVRGHWKCHQR
jgi:hypothetical protein